MVTFLPFPFGDYFTTQGAKIYILGKNKWQGNFQIFGLFIHKKINPVYNVNGTDYIVTSRAKKVNIFSQKGVDKCIFLCYTIQAIKSGHSRGDANSAGVAKLADARDLKSRGARAPYGFDSRSRHHT